MKPHLLLLGLSAAATHPTIAREVQARSAAEEAKSFLLPDGYRMELVLSEPHIKEPVVTVFDGDGRMFVAEMRTYMQDIDGNDQRKPTSRISMHTDANGDGNYDKHSVFVDDLVLPRMILPLGKGQIVVNETDTLDLYLYTDTDNDGVSDKKELWWQGGPRGGNLEHQPSGLVWAIDNAIYTTYNSFRLRWTPGGVVKEDTKPNDGQWGLGQDNHGSLYYVNAGGEKGPVSFQAPVVYGMFNPRDQFADGFKELFPAAGARDFQGGPGRVREPDGTLNGFTSGAGIDVFRGDQLPADMLGDVFFGEPVGRLVRRAKVTMDGGLKILSNPYQEEKSEFLRSTDLCFRPVNMSNAPDGTLYITDMYRGIIQEAAWVNRGSYLRGVVEEHRFDKVAGLGRIWRLAHRTTRPVKQPRMYSESTQQLVAHLAHPNGWWRDTAQRLIVLRQDRAVVPMLEDGVRRHTSYLARMHALWTLQGLGAVTPELVRKAMEDPHPQVRVAAIRVSESLYQAGDTSLAAGLEALTRDDAPEVVLQACLTARYLDLPGHKTLISDTVVRSKAEGVKQIGPQLLLAPGQKLPDLTDRERSLMKKGEEIYSTLCASCHGDVGRGVEVAGLEGALIAPPMAGSKTVTGDPKGVVYVLLKGLEGEIEGKKYEGLMISMATNDDDWIASVASYVRNSFGNHGSFVTPADVAKARQDTAGKYSPWSYRELQARLPQAVANSSLTVTASDNNGSAPMAIDGDTASRFTTGRFMVPGMWFQVQLQEATPLSGLVLDAGDSANDYPRQFELRVSDDGTHWSDPVATGAGKSPVTEIRFKPVRAKYVRITQQGKADGNYWSIHDLKLLREPAG
ncbi:DUF7133 domain-containing protein [Luteolibacter marinus]|uniref:DUF7133 domain-containing protein n=1 Tax=Luteolibacter marinus TaxID=2776705 RepID=UPI00186755ED|nr:discoidin domain-containing protein [Luteolibacter marinus]